MNEILDHENQFNNGIKILISAHETQVTLLSNEISRLNNELEEKNEKIKKLDELCTRLIKEKTEYELTISSLNKQIAYLQGQFMLPDDTIQTKTSRKSNSTNKKKSIIPKGETPNFLNVNLEEQFKENGNGSFISNDKFDKLTASSVFQDYKSKNRSFTGNRHKFFKTDIRNLSTELYKQENQNQMGIKQIQMYSTINHNNTNNNSRSQRDALIRNLSASSSFYDKISMGKNATNRTYINIEREMNGKKDGDFFKKCRAIMTPNEYSELIEIVHLFNSKQISRQETYKNIANKLRKGDYDSLLTEFNNLFL